MDLYPPGWQYAEQDKAKVEPEEEDLIKSLVDKAISAGILQRRQGRRVEHKFTGVFDQAPGVFGAHLVVTGKIDLLEPPDTVIDHKTTKEMRYALSEEKLRDDNQLLFYAKVLADDYPEQQTFKLAHINYAKDKAKIDRREVEVTRAEVDARFEVIRGLARDMQALASQGLREDQWAQVPGALQGHGSGPERCAFPYGKGCRYLSICARTECGGGSDADQVKSFRRRYLRLAGVEFPTEESVKMGLRDKLSKITGQAPAEPEKKDESIQVLLDQITELGQAQDKLETLELKEGLPMGPVVEVKPETAKRKQRKPCSVCQQPIKAGEDFAAFGADGKKHLTCPTVSRMAQEVAVATVNALTDREIDNRPDEEVFQETINAPDPKLIVLRGCAITKEDVQTGSPLPLLSLTDVMDAALDIAGNTREEFYKADVWQRRDALKAIGQKIAERLGSAYVLARKDLDGDEAALVSAISPFATLEIGALA